jgi:hypothetical protein
MRRSATIEALARFSRALAPAASLPEERSRSDRELALLLKLGLASQIANGPASQQTGDFCERAEAASRALKEPRQEFMAAWGREMEAHHTHIPVLHMMGDFEGL